VVAHLHHGLRPQADDDAAFVQATAAAWGVRVVVAQVDVRQLAQEEGWTLEEAARRPLPFSRGSRSRGGRGRDPSRPPRR
jgi:tRNA(Ile)-lysidine synthase TilS/MesJ